MDIKIQTNTDNNKKQAIMEKFKFLLCMFIESFVFGLG